MDIIRNNLIWAGYIINIISLKFGCINFRLFELVCRL